MIMMSHSTKDEREWIVEQYSIEAKEVLLVRELREMEDEYRLRASRPTGRAVTAMVLTIICLALVVLYMALTAAPNQ